MKVSEYYEQQKKPWMGVGTVFEVSGGIKYVVARLHFKRVLLVNVHGHHRYFGDETFVDDEALARSERELTEEECRHLLSSCWRDAKIVGRIS